MKKPVDLTTMFSRREKGICPFCGKKVIKRFKDRKSAKEFKISGICQKCQDKTFVKVKVEKFKDGIGLRFS
jgi:predicted RNA-binding Zn-ribbon protein involved in translation (DUF1610 family)